MENAVLSKEEPDLDNVVEMNIFLKGMSEPVSLITTYEWALGFHFAWTEFVNDNTKSPIGSIKSTSGRASHFLLSEVVFVTVSVY
jgi:hypothetical protein